MQCPDYVAFHLGVHCLPKYPLGVSGLNRIDKLILHISLTLYLIETPFNIFTNRADPDQAALVRAT